MTVNKRLHLRAEIGLYNVTVVLGPKYQTGYENIGRGTRSFAFWRVFVLTLKRNRKTGYRLSTKRIHRPNDVQEANL